MAEAKKDTIEEIVVTRLLRLNAVVQGIVTGIVCGLGLFAATNWLILRGGHFGPEGERIIGPHLSLLSQFFIGYRVTFLGSLVGFGHAFLLGFIIAYAIARIYNWCVDFKEKRSQVS